MGNYPLTSWDDAYFIQEGDEWRVVLNDSSLAIVNDILDGGDCQTGVKFRSDLLKIGDNIAQVHEVGAINVTIVGLV